MKETIRMWKNTRMVVLTALTAAVYAAILLPMKGIQIIPGITELRPAAVIPIVFGLLFGPAGAWGSAIGNIIGDFFGTLSIGSIAGFFGNFFFALTAYKLWGRIGPKNMELKKRTEIMEFIVTAILSSISCAFVIAWGLEILRLYPFAAIGAIITTNNSIAGVIIGPFILRLLYLRVKRLGLLWTDIMDIEPVKNTRTILGTVFILIGLIGGLITGFLISTGVYDNVLFAFDKGSVGSGVFLGTSPFLILFLLGTILA